MPRAPASGSTLRPWPIPELQVRYLATMEAQLFATVALVATFAFAAWAVRRMQPPLRRRYGTNLAEAGSLAGMALLVIVSLWAISVIWHVTYVLEYTLASAGFDRFTLAQQLVTGAVILTTYLTIRFVNRSIDRLGETDAITTHQSEVAYHVADVAIVAFAGTILLTLWGIDLTNVFIGAGAITVIVALTARQTLSAMLAGFILLFTRPFRVGDWIAVGDTSGIVTDVTIFNTKIQTFGDEHVLVPNDEITDRGLKNFTENDQLRVEVEVGIDYDEGIERARAVAEDAARELDSIKDAPAPEVVAKGFGDSAILLELRVWIDGPTSRRAHSARTDAIEAVRAAFDREGIDIPYPQRVHSTRSEDGIALDAPADRPPERSTADD